MNVATRLWLLTRLSFFALAPLCLLESSKRGLETPRQMRPPKRPVDYRDTERFPNPLEKADKVKKKKKKAIS